MPVDRIPWWPDDLDERLALARRILRYQPDLYAAEVTLSRDEIEILQTALAEYDARRSTRR